VAAGVSTPVDARLRPPGEEQVLLARLLDAVREAALELLA
jgi:hypothetical protein